MSIARHHAEWLSLVPVSGPFLSLPVLLKAFPQGLDAHDPDHARLLRLAYAEWDESFQRKQPDPSVQDAWIKFVLTKTLEFDEDLLAEGQAIPQTLHAEMSEHHELLRPSIVINDPVTKKYRLLIKTYARSQDLVSYVAGSRWKASPDTRMTELLHATGVRLGLVTNGEHWMLVDAPKGETTGYVSWYASLWLEEKITLRAFRSLLSLTRFFGVAADQTIEALLTESASNQQEVTDQLGYQVRRAVEVLIQSLDKADQDHGRELLEGVSEAVLYESALTVMMRLVFLFCAEERELIPTKPFPVYEQNYSVSMISKQLREIADQQGEELLEQRYDAWPRLLTANRIVFGGVRHDDVHVPIYGGRLFDPDRFPFLEGRKRGTSWREAEANPLPVNNRTILHLLEALQLLQIKVPGGGPAEARRLSFRALDIEQIGHVYEGLLDHTAKRATEPFLGLTGTRSKEPEIPVAELEKLFEKDEADLFKFLKGETGRSQSALKKALSAEIDGQEVARLRIACQGDEELWKRVEPFAGLIRNDSFGYPWVIFKGSVFVTAGTDRRSSGTHYTPRSLTEPIVQYTLEPLVYDGPADGKPKEEWKLKSPAELLNLNICDMACGSGAFLVQACRYMSERLLEAWDEAEKQIDGTPRITPIGDVSKGGPEEQLIPVNTEERLVYARRIVASRCLYGVDVNPLAAEMAKLSLWLLTLAKDKPFEFLDHAIRCGDSLVGLHDLEQLRHYSLNPDDDDAVLFKGPLDDAVDKAINLRLKLEDMPANTVADIEAQEKLLAEAEDKIARLRCSADLLVAAAFWGENAADKKEKVRHAAVVSGQYVENGPTEEFKKKATKERRGQKMFHWPLEFPEVIVKRSGFDAFVGNPPFIGGRRIRRSIGRSYLKWLTEVLAAKASGNADLCAFFFRRIASLLCTHGYFGLIATNTISQGDTRDVGLAHLLDEAASLVRAVRSTKWPGRATVEISKVWGCRSSWNGDCVLEGKLVHRISHSLTVPGIISGLPKRLCRNSGMSFQGTIVLGTGFILTPKDAQDLISENDHNRKIIMPYLTGEDFNKRPDRSPSRWVINFFDWPLNREMAPEDYVGEVAADYPTCLHLIEERVKPERTRKKKKKEFVLRKPLPQKWWVYADKRPQLYNVISQLDRVLFHPFVSKYVQFDFVPSTYVYAGPSIVIATDQYIYFAALQSSFHVAWAREHCSTMGGGLRYANRDLFETFPFPDQMPSGLPLAEFYLQTRRRLSIEAGIGLTEVYNRFHESDETSEGIQRLRELHIEMDQAVAAAYGWDDLELGHGFHETKQGLRYTINEPARREVLQRLLKLNHERYEEEVRQGLHDKKKGRKKKSAPKKTAKKSGKQEPTLLDLSDSEDR